VKGGRDQTSLIRPKSQIFSKKSYLESKRFSGFKSLWKYPFWWRFCNPKAIWYIITRINYSGIWEWFYLYFW